MRSPGSLFSIRGIRLGVAAVVVGIFGLGMVPLANATPISFYNTASTQDTLRLTLGCGSATGGCSGLLEVVSNNSPLTWSSSVGQMLHSPLPADPASETTFVNDLLGLSLTATSGNNSPAANFSTDADYILLKAGGGPTHQAYALLHNLDGTLDLYYTAANAGGLSGWITFASSASTPVPEPADLGVFGLGVLLVGGFVTLRRRYS